MKMPEKYLRPPTSRTPRRDRRKPGLAMIMSVITLFGLVACGGGSTGPGGGSDGKLTYAVTSPITPPQLPPYVGPIISGKEFDLDLSMANLKVLNSTNTALQLLLSGEIDVTGGAFLSYLQAREKQPKLRAFCPGQATTNAVVVSTNPNVKSLADLSSESVQVLVESPGGPNDYFLDEAFKAENVNLRVKDIPNTRVVENMEQRFTALASRNADVAVVWNYNVADLENAAGKDNVTVLADFTDYASVYLAYISTVDWLRENAEQAAAFCAAVLKTNKDLAGDYNLFNRYVDEYVEGDPPQEQVRTTWEAANGSSMWPAGGALDEKTVNPLVDMAFESKLITEKLAVDEIVDRRPTDAALKLLASSTPQ